MGAYYCVQNRSLNASFRVDVDSSRQPLFGPDVRYVSSMVVLWTADILNTTSAIRMAIHMGADMA